MKDLKTMAKCYVASLEFDYVPEGDKAAEVHQIFGFTITSEELDRYAGTRHDEMAREMAEAILKEKSDG
jgi:hypothetical protein